MKKKNITEQELDFTDVFFKEVSEDVQNDNIKAFWKKYGIHIIAFVTICLTIAVSFETIKHWRDLKNQEYSNAFAYAQSLYNQGETENSLKALTDLVNHGNATYKDIASLKIINILLEQNQTEDALKRLEDFSRNAHKEKFKNAALMKLATYKADTLSAQEMSDLLSPLFKQENSAWQMEAKELVALCALRDGDKKQALALYEEIAKASDLNDILRSRVQNMISVLTSTGDNK